MEELQLLENDHLRVAVRNKGAELSTIYHKHHHLEYLWQADPAFWPKQSPVLFPIVGTLCKGQYNFNEKTYQLPRHGFARDQNFTLETKTGTYLAFLFSSNEAILIVYPFPFELRIIYDLQDAILSVTYRINNTGKNTLFFSIGAHPAFRIPLENDKVYEDYFLRFEKNESCDRWPITDNGLISNHSESFLTDQHLLPLNKSLFRNDAIVFKDLKSDCISIESHNSSHGIRMTFHDFPFFGIWSAKGADFICLEPWCGIADSEQPTQDITQKEGINSLGGGDTFEITWSVHCY